MAPLPDPYSLLHGFIITLCESTTTKKNCISHERLAHYVQPGTLLCLFLALYFMVLNWAEDSKSIRMSCVATVNFFVGGFYVLFYVNLKDMLFLK